MSRKSGEHKTTPNSGRSVSRGGMPQVRIKTRPVWFYIAVTLILTFIDQLIKYAVRTRLDVGGKVTVFGGFDIKYVQNNGAAFNFMAGKTTLIIAVTLVVIAAGIVFIVWQRKKHPMLQLWASIIIGGAVGNLIDRLTHGYVIDYIDIHIMPVFNFADICVTVGVLFLCLYITVAGRVERAE